MSDFGEWLAVVALPARYLAAAAAILVIVLLALWWLPRIAQLGG